jgi:hypothetical protein
MDTAAAPPPVLGGPPLLGGLRLVADDRRAAARDAALAILGVTVVIAVADGLVFRRWLPGWYVGIFGGPDLLVRIAFYMWRCVGEEVVYRLLLMTALVAVGARLWGTQGKAPAWVVWGAILIAQAVNMIPKQPAPQSLLEVPWAFLRFYVPGVVWGWLYWRRGFITPLLAHPAAHLVLQPILLWELAR